MASTIAITYDDVIDGPTELSGNVLYAETTFEAQMAAIPGAFRVVVSDPTHVYNFTTGRELTLDVDGVRVYGGWVFNVSKEYFFPADDTTNPGTVRGRKWVLTGVDYNILLEKRVLYNHTAPKSAVATVGTGGIYDGAVIRTYFGTWFDLPSGFDFSNASYILDNHQFATGYQPPTPGATLKDVLETMSQFGSVYYIDASKRLNFIPVQETLATWGFSDAPSLGDSPPTIGFRDGTMTEDASAVVNDAFVWGGSAWNLSGSIAYRNESNATSVTNHGRWQYAEVHVGDRLFAIQDQVTERARVIVNGNNSGLWQEGTQGLVNPEKQFIGTWFAQDVPSADHLIPPQVVWIDLQVFGFTMYVPLRQVQVSFPGLAPDGTAYVQFEGIFGVLMTDPHWLWAYLKKQRGQQVSGEYGVADNNTTTPSYGDTYQGIPTPTPNGVTTSFFIPFVYIGGTTVVSINGLTQRLGVDYTESDPAAGQITFTTAPSSTDTLYVRAVLAG